MRTEDRLIRYCARTALDQNQQAKIKRLLSPKLDWAYFFKKIQTESLSPLVYKTFLKLEDSEAVIPPDILQHLKHSYYSCLGDNISYLSQLEKIIGNFQDEDIATIIFKGLVLCELIYADFGVRSSGDLDILVRKEDVFKVDKILRELDYYTTFDIKNFKEVHFSNYRNSFFYLPKDKAKVPVHIYWHLINFIPYNRNVSCGIDIDKVWLKAELIKLGNISLHTLSTVHQLIYLSMHALSHSFYPLVLLCDINEFLRLKKEKLDWNSLIEEAFKFGLSKHVYYTLYLASEILGTDILKDSLSKLKPKSMSIFERRFISSLLKGKPVFTAEGIVYLGMNETLIDRLSFLRRALFAPKRELALVRGKEVRKINIFDYLRRVYSGFNHLAKAAKLLYA